MGELVFEMSWTDAKGVDHDAWFAADEDGPPVDIWAFVGLYDDLCEYQATGQWDPQYNADLERILHDGVWEYNGDPGSSSRYWTHFDIGS